MAPPRGWPAQVTYLDCPRLSSLLSQAQRDALLSAHLDSAVESVGQSRKTRIVLIDDAQHPAHGQRGLFAGEHLEPGAFILPYIGFVHCDADQDDESDYDLSQDRDLGIGVDASKMGNEARFVNDYRGIPSRQDKGPNAEFRDCFVAFKGGAAGGAKTMGVFVLPAGKSSKRAGGITKGEEIVVSYGKGFWAGRMPAE